MYYNIVQGYKFFKCAIFEGKWCLIPEKKTLQTGMDNQNFFLYILIFFIHILISASFLRQYHDITISPKLAHDCKASSVMKQALGQS